ncbi:hypothetical protein PsalMR5_02823 [Piscirickettsia salmonis]|nr:hypothetical protein PsalSR1_02822 [Piscirickettsia salmonis]QGP64943.1 hypothetical protein PsalMR5_02823 [Piscirickettsia salmonis]
MGLNQAVYIEKVFNQPKQFEKNYQRLETMGLSQRAYVEKIINKAELIDEIELNKYALLKLNSAGLNQAQHVQYVIDNPIEFDKKNICLKNIKNIYFIVRNKLNNFQLHGFNIFKFRKSGTSIKYNKKIIFVPKGIAAVWNKITDENGNFNVDYTDAASLYHEVKSMLSKRQKKCIALNEQFLTLTSLLD